MVHKMIVVQNIKINSFGIKKITQSLFRTDFFNISVIVLIKKVLKVQKEIIYDD